MTDLQTVDIPAVEILSTGGPVHGHGSPPEGDFWTRDQLEEMAVAARELAHTQELDAPMKIGHDDAQTLVKNSALPAITPGEMPAVGWLDGTTARVVDGQNGVEAVLVMDAKDVPRQFADLIKAKAYRKRSAELSRVTSQVTQKTYDWVVSGVAWLGSKLPAVQTLQDIVALYEREEIPVADGVRAIVLYAAPVVAWAPDQSFNGLRDDVSQALNGPQTGGATMPRFWVCDIALDQKSAYAQDYYADGDDGWIIPFTIDDDGAITISPSSDWKAVEDALVFSDDKSYEARRYATWTSSYINALPDSAFLFIEPGGEKDDDGKTTPRSLRHLPVRNANGDIDEGHVDAALSRLGQESTGSTGSDSWLTDTLRASLTKKALGLRAQLNRKNARPVESRPMELTLTEAQETEIREQLELAADVEVTGEHLLQANAKQLEARDAKIAEYEQRRNEQDTELDGKLRDLETALKAEQRRSFETRRDADIEKALRERDLDPADVEKWEKRYDTLGEDNARELLFELPTRAIRRELGADGGDGELTVEQQRELAREMDKVFPGAGFDKKAAA